MLSSERQRMKWGEKASVIGPSPANPAIDGWLYIRQAENIWSLDKGGNDKWILVSRGEEGRGREVGRGGGVKGREEGEMNWEVELWATHGDRDRGTTVLVGLAVGGEGGKMAKAAMSVGQKPGRAGGSSLIDGAWLLIINYIFRYRFICFIYALRLGSLIIYWTFENI